MRQRAAQCLFILHEPSEGRWLRNNQPFTIVRFFGDTEKAMPRINNIVLVHGGFVDGAGWRGVYDLLKRDGFNVSIVQNPTICLLDPLR